MNNQPKPQLDWIGDDQMREATFGGIPFAVSRDVGDDGKPDGDYTLGLHGNDGSRFRTLYRPGDWTKALLAAEQHIADGDIQHAELITDDEEVSA